MDDIIIEPGDRFIFQASTRDERYKPRIRVIAITITGNVFIKDEADNDSFTVPLPTAKMMIADGLWKKIDG